MPKGSRSLIAGVFVALAIAWTVGFVVTGMSSPALEGVCTRPPGATMSPDLEERIRVCNSQAIQNANLRRTSLIPFPINPALLIAAYSAGLIMLWWLGRFALGRLR